MPTECNQESLQFHPLSGREVRGQFDNGAITSKVAGELLAFQFYWSYGSPIVRARPFNHTGPRQSPAFVCSSFA